MENLERFLTAQDALYERAIKEIQEGKLGLECWVRYVYPQLKRFVPACSFLHRSRMNRCLKGDCEIWMEIMGKTTKTVR
jgi:uncharacterized protein (DUF1810 family)